MKIKMKKILLSLFGLATCFLLGSCGYTTKSALPPNFKTIYVESFANKIDWAAERRRNIYFPLLEVKIKNAIIDRFLFDGNLRIADEDKATLILKGELVSYNRYALRYTDNDDVQEYRIVIMVNLELLEEEDQPPLWVENSFAGEAEYFITGPDAITEAAAVELAKVDLARRIVERTIENW